ncbi:TIGR00180 family glycosyltransferase [Chlorobium phaeovibrioides]|uniref:TIGR00180 family glycosyltransferase n=1 Tax=Chlorobium phaeovibrioides TaxID=1094 RepID=UPI000F819619|nr:TIGR00180 family glycosyltransferase [Chlorobium phaeovibrioides]RTY34143.1 TIGR00180 family glycosyltransferase [Chlorobium phaeovibrioides]
MLSKLTIVIPSFERQEYLLRQVNYWANKNVKVIILDGSKNKWSHIGFANVNIEYFHIPESIENRFLFASTRIYTEYAVLLSDDELFISSALESCINYLDHNIDTVSCKGVALGFNYFNGQVFGDDVYPTLRNSSSLHQSTARARMLSHMYPYNMTTLWAVIKKNVFIATLKAMGSGGPYKSAAIGEVQTSLLTSYFGKCHILDELMWLRSAENKNIWWDAGPLSIVQWYTDIRNYAEVQKVFDSIDAQIFFSDKAMFREWLIESMDAYVNAYGGATPISINTVLNAIKRCIPPKIKLAIKKNLHRNQDLTLQFNATPLMDAVKVMAASGVTVDFQELANIERIVTDFHKNRVMN